MTLLFLNNCSANVTRLGPAPAVGVWTQFCSVGCAGCMSKDTWERGKIAAEPRDVAAWANSLDRHFLVLSGGEPFDQAEACCELIDACRAERDWIVTSYSGFSREHLEREVRASSRALLSRLDLLIDGPYLQQRHGQLLWRGSTNQRIHDLTGRVVLPADVSVGVEATVTSRAVEVIGVPPFPNFVSAFEAATGEALIADPVPEPSRFPFPTHEVS